MKQTSLTLIEKLSNAPGVSGFEEEVVAITKKETTHFETRTDSLNNLYIETVNEPQDKLTILFDAHSDEVGFIVQAIRPNGLIEFLPVGGWVPHTISAQPVKIRNKKNQYITGIVASKPPHFMSDAEKNIPPQIEHFVIDVGCTSAKEVTENLHISVGAPVVPDSTFDYNEGTNTMRGKAFDCRIGCACLLETFATLTEQQTDDFHLSAVISSQEEVGLRGITVAMKSIHADLAIVFEGCPADDSFTPDYQIQSGIRRGPMLRHFDVSMITNPRFQQFALDVAEKHQLPVQHAVRKGGGNNGAVINLAERGIPTIVIGIPVRYAHTHYGYVSYEDYETAKELAVAIVQELTPSIIQSF